MGIISAFPGKSKPKLQSKTVTPTTSAQTVTPSSGYDGLDKVTVNRIPTSYVQPSSTQTAKTWTPGSSNQYIPAGTYCSGQQTIQGDADLVASNIKSGVSIFGVTGSFTGGRIGSAVSASSSAYNKLTFSVNTTNLIGFYFYATGSPQAWGEDYIQNTNIKYVIGGFYNGSTVYVNYLQFRDNSTAMYADIKIASSGISATISSGSISLTPSDENFSFLTTSVNLIPVYSM